MNALLQTKLHRPLPSQRSINRPQLQALLDQSLADGKQIILVSAPAGFGKTTCISSWVDHLSLPVCWLSLDPEDDDPGRFFTYLIAAIQQANSAAGRDILGILNAGQLPPPEIISTTLINDLSLMNTPFLLVLDDLQELTDPLILQVMDKLVDNLPGMMHLVLISREDPPLPLARLRANNQLTEIRTPELRFAQSEAQVYLNDVMELSLSRHETDTLDERTEGWIAGLHLAGLSMRGHNDPAGFISNLRGSHRYILSYLTDEVLNRQPADLQQFLLQTSILNTFNCDLCDAITGRSDSRIMLERLYSINMFLVPLDDEGRWYRYHHLFGEMLSELQNSRHKSSVPALHQRASQWYEIAGAENENFTAEAIRHAILAGDYEAAIRLIESHTMGMLVQWHIKTVEGWMRAIPADWIAGNFAANLTFAWIYLLRGSPLQAFPYIERLQKTIASIDPDQLEPAVQSRWYALQAMLLNGQGSPGEALALCNQALALVPEGDIHLRSLIDTILSGAYQQLGDDKRAFEAFEDIVHISRTEPGSVSEILGISGLGLLAIRHGHLHLAYDTVSRIVEKVERSGTIPPIMTALYGELGDLHYTWHQLDLANTYFLRAIQVGTLSGYPDASLFYSVILSRLQLIRGNLQEAACEIQKAVDLMQVETAAAVPEEVIAQQVRVYLALDMLLQAETVLKGYGFHFSGSFKYPPFQPGSIHRISSRENMSSPTGTLYLSALRVLHKRACVHQQTEILPAGLELLDSLIAAALEHQFIPFLIESLLIRAGMRDTLGDTLAKDADITQAIELAAPEGFISLFVEEGSFLASSLEKLLSTHQVKPEVLAYCRIILSAIASHTRQDESIPAPKGQSGLIEPLTERELEVLRLMAEGLTYEQIAQRLYISLNTVRSHVKSAYSKTGANNRTRAIEIARQLNLL